MKGGGLLGGWFRKQIREGSYEGVGLIGEWKYLRKRGGVEGLIMKYVVGYGVICGWVHKAWENGAQSWRLEKSTMREVEVGSRIWDIQESRCWRERTE